MADLEWKSDSHEDAKEILRRHAELKDLRQPFDSVWEEAAKLGGTMFQGFTGEIEHPKLNPLEVMDRTAASAAATYSAGMLSGASSPAEPWFNLTLVDKELAEFPRVREYLQLVEGIIYETLSQCAYYPNQTTGYHQSGLFGWQALYVGEEDLPGMGGRKIMSRAMPLHKSWIDEDANKVVDTFAHTLRLTARQAAGRWGKDNLPDIVKQALNSKTENLRGGSSRTFDFLHMVFPADERNEARLGRNHLPFASLWVCMDGRCQVVKEGGYRTFPFIVTRSYLLPETPYSYSPGTEALADVRMMNELKRLIVEAGQLAVAPPYLVPDDGLVGRFSFEPRAINYFNRSGGTAQSADFKPLEIGGNPNLSIELLNMVKQDIQDAFYVQYFSQMQARIRSGTTPTAREVEQLDKEKLWLLGPLLMQQEHEGFDQLFERVINIKLDRGEIPQPPMDLLGQELRFEYISPLALAQKERKSGSIVQTYNELGAIAQITGDTGIWDNLDNDKAAGDLMRQRGFPADAVRGENERDAMRQARQQALAQQQQSAELLEAAKAVPSLSKAPEKGSPAAAVMEGMQ